MKKLAYAAILLGCLLVVPLVAGLARTQAAAKNPQQNSTLCVFAGWMATSSPSLAQFNGVVVRVSINAAIEYMRQYGLDDVVDAYGIHTYPSANGPGPAAAAGPGVRNLKVMLFRNAGPRAKASRAGSQNGDLRTRMSRAR